LAALVEAGRDFRLKADAYDFSNERSLFLSRGFKLGNRSGLLSRLGACSRKKRAWKEKRNGGWLFCVHYLYYGVGDGSQQAEIATNNTPHVVFQVAGTDERHAAQETRMFNKEGGKP
jgi:hypothetical protein